MRLHFIIAVVLPAIASVAANTAVPASVHVRVHVHHASDHMHSATAKTSGKTVGRTPRPLDDDEEAAELGPLHAPVDADSDDDDGRPPAPGKPKTLPPPLVPRPKNGTNTTKPQVGAQTVMPAALGPQLVPPTRLPVGKRKAMVLHIGSNDGEKDEGLPSVSDKPKTLPPPLVPAKPTATPTSVDPQLNSSAATPTTKPILGAPQNASQTTAPATSSATSWSLSTVTTLYAMMAIVGCLLS